MLPSLRSAVYSETASGPVPTGRRMFVAQGFPLFRNHHLRDRYPPRHVVYGVAKRIESALVDVDEAAREVELEYGLRQAVEQFAKTSFVSARVDRYRRLLIRGHGRIVLRSGNAASGSARSDPSC